MCYKKYSFLLAGAEAETGDIRGPKGRLGPGANNVANSGPGPNAGGAGPNDNSIMNGGPGGNNVNGTNGGTSANSGPGANPSPGGKTSVDANANDGKGTGCSFIQLPMKFFCNFWSIRVRCGSY